MKTQKIYFRKENKEGKLIYDKKRNNIIENLLKNNIFLYTTDGTKKIKNKNIKDKDLKGFNNSNCFVEESKINYIDLYISIHNETLNETSIENIKTKGLNKSQKKEVIEYLNMLGIETSMKGKIVERKYITERTEEDIDGLRPGLYNDDLKILTYNYKMSVYDNLYNIANDKKIDIQEIYSLNPTLNEGIDFIENEKGVGETYIRLPFNFITKFYIKKLNKQEKNIQQIIHTYVTLNGFNQEEFFNLYFKEIKSIHRFLKLKLYTNTELSDEWRKVTFAMKNHTELHYSLIGGDITTTKYLFNYEKIIEDIDKTLDIKEQQKQVNKKITQYKRFIVGKLNEIEIVNYIEKHKGNTITDYSQLLNKSENTIRKIIKKQALDVKTNTDQVKININLTYDWFIMMKLLPSIKALIEGSKKVKDNQDIFYSEKTIRKHIDRKIYSEKEYQKSLSKIQVKDDDEKIEGTKKIQFLEDDDEMDFWFGGDDFIKELDNEKIDDPDMELFEPAVEYNKTIQKINYKHQREKYKNELKVVEDKIREVIERDKLGYDDIEWNELDNKWLKKMGYTIKQIYDRISLETSKKLEEELKQTAKDEEYFKQLAEADDRRSRLDRVIDDIFDIDD